MNDTAKKLRDITQNAGVTPGSDKPYGVIAAIKSAFGFDSILAAGVLLQFMAAIADELDELQARAAGANNLRQQLESAEKKAERRKQHIGYLETALHDKNALLEQRGGTIARLTAECSELRKQAPSERERQILAMWPRFEDGDYVWFGDIAKLPTHGAISVEAIEFTAGKVCVKDAEDGDWDTSMYAMRPLKRPAPEVLDADGVPTKVGDTVYGIGRSQHVFEVIDPHHIDPEVGDAFSVRCYDRDEAEECHCRPELLTHTRPDSWELLEEDAAELDDMPCDFNAKDLIRRAKALAGVEVD